jgi:hypothetical protein
MASHRKRGFARRIGVWSSLSISHLRFGDGDDTVKLREIAHSVEEIMRNDPNMRTVNVDGANAFPSCTSSWIRSDCN